MGDEDINYCLFVFTYSIESLHITFVIIGIHSIVIYA